MTSQEQPTTSSLEALIEDGALTGSWTLDPARSEVRLRSRHTWGLRPVHGVFRQLTGNGTVTAGGRTRPLSFDAKVSAAAGEVQLDAEIPVNRADFGLAYSPLRMASLNNT